MLKIQQNNANKGFSLIEALITIFIVAAVLVLYIAATNALRIIKTSKDNEIALRIANNKLEELRASGYDNLPASGDFSNDQFEALPNSSGELTITDSNSRTKQVEVTVEWRRPSNETSRSVSLTTLITKVGGI